jgi:hypothetical protein
MMSITLVDFQRGRPVNEIEQTRRTDLCDEWVLALSARPLFRGLPDSAVIALWARGKERDGGDGQNERLATMDDSGQLYDASQLDDFQVIAERSRIMTALASVTGQYRAINAEMRKRETLQWILAP